MKKDKGTWLLAAALVVVLAIGGAAYRALSGEYGARQLQAVDSGEREAREEEAEAEQERIKAPDFSMLDWEGDSVTLSSFEGRPVVLNFWASWCPPCKQEMPEFAQAWGELEEDIAFLMVDMVDGSRETVETGRAYIEGEGYSFPVYFDHQQAAYAYGVTSIPSTYFIDSEGYVAAAARGMIDRETLLLGIQMARDGAQ